MEYRKTLKSIVGGIVLCLIILFYAHPVEAASSRKVTGTCEYDKAYEVLALVNKQRGKNGVEKLTMDKDLLEAAMLRAAECTILFEHTRPNGSSWKTVSEKVYGENIAYGYGTADYVMDVWMNSTGHRNNILRDGYTSIGIGCFYMDGIRYWVQCFGYNEADKVSKPENRMSIYTVALTSSGETKLVTSGGTTNPLKTKVSGFKATAGKKKLTLQWKKKSGIDGYQLQISANKKFHSKQSCSIDKTTTKKIIKKYKGKKLKAKKKYYVRIRAYTKSINANGEVEMQYSKWKTISKKTK